MSKIGIISDTHGILRQEILDFLCDTDEIWHAGDIGSLDVLDKLSSLKPSKFVFGNADNDKIRIETKEINIFVKDGIKVLMTHIANYKNYYNKKTIFAIEKEKPDLLISGHSHILKIIRDNNYNFLHINPGACGNYGFNPFITAVKISIENGKIFDVVVFEKAKSF